MDPRFYNVSKRKKLAEWVDVQETGSTDYDLGLYYLSHMIHELLEASYFSKKSESKLIRQEEYIFSGENYEINFVNRIIDVFTEITLSKLLDHTKKTWSFHELLEVVKKFNWPDEAEIKRDIDTFEAEIRDVITARHERFAHTSKKNKPNMLYARRMRGYSNLIKKPMKMLDNFVDGEIPYFLYHRPGDFDLRETINTK